MAVKLTVAVLFFVVSFAHASIPSDQVENKVLTDESVIAVSDPDSKATILLPSEKPNFEPATIVDLKPDQSLESEIATGELTEEKRESEADHAVHLTTISFRPINRHYERRPWLLSSRQGRPCHLHRSRAFKRGGFRARGRVIPYGNDMILSDEDLSFVPKSKDGKGRISAKPHHDGPKHWFKSEMDMREDREETTGHRHRHHHHHQYHPDQDIEGEEREHHHKHFHHRKHDEGLMMKLRKFLNNF